MLVHNFCNFKLILYRLATIGMSSCRYTGGVIEVLILVLKTIRIALLFKLLCYLTGKVSLKFDFRSSLLFKYGREHNIYTQIFAFNSLFFVCHPRATC